MSLGALALAACSTPYQDMGLLGGVNATQIDSTTLRISGRGNGFTDSAQINNYVLLKAAEETVARGYDLFQIVNDRDATRHEVWNMSSTTTRPVFGVTVGGEGVMGLATETTNTPVAYTKPGEDILIRMYSGIKPAGAPPNLYAAREVIAYLGPEVQRRGDHKRARPSAHPAAPAPSVWTPERAADHSADAAPTTVGRF